MADDDPFDLRADIDDFEKKLLARVRADADAKRKKAAVASPRRTARPSLFHLREPKVCEDIARLLHLKAIEFRFDEGTRNARLIVKCHCKGEHVKLMAEEVIAAMTTADEVNAIFEEMDAALRALCSCTRPRPTVSMR